MAKARFTSMAIENPPFPQTGTVIGCSILIGTQPARYKGTDGMHLPILVDRQSFDDAAALIETFGEQACIEAALRADQSRERGNHIHFCHWRQIERMVVLLQVDQAMGTVH